MKILPDQSKFSVSVIILTLNEEMNLSACLESVRQLTGGVVVVDAGSFDRTRSIAAEFGATVVEHPFQTHSQQWLWALENVAIQSEWILALDADQQLTPELAHEISRLDPSTLADIEGLYLKRRQVFRNRWIKHGGYYPKYLLKMFRRSKVVIDPNDQVDHHFYIPGRTMKLQYDMIEANRKEDDISFWIEKHNRYAALLANEEYRWRTGARTAAISPALNGTPDQRILALKNIWRHMPLFVRPFLYFTYRYFFRFGFLDGKQGAIFHFMQAFWFRLLVDIKLDELQREGSRS